MNKKWLWCCFGLCVSKLCSADSVQLYGLVDQGIQINLQESQASIEDHFKIKQGNKMASRIGLRGKEEISPSHFVFFNLEGETNPNHPTALFKRRNLIGYENRQLGQLTLGLQSSVSFDIARLIDPSGLIRQKYVIDDLSGTFNGRYGNKWIDQAIKYSYHSDHFNFIMSYQFDGAQDSHHKNYALGLSYQQGDRLFAGSYSQSKPSMLNGAGRNSQIINAGITQKIGKVHLKLGVSHSDLSPATPHALKKSYRPSLEKLQNIGLGFKYQVKPHIDIFSAAYRQKSNAVSEHALYGNKYVLGGNYHLSKQTHLYAFLNHANGSDSGEKIDKITSATMGMVHRF